MRAPIDTTSADWRKPERDLKRDQKEDRVYECIQVQENEIRRFKYKVLDEGEVKSGPEEHRSQPDFYGCWRMRKSGRSWSWQEIAVNRAVDDTE